ncbi:MAG: hypothetical protein NTY65_09235 [Planctomycetota bacterium]|nr:hypothetical protein [Planctomycetota bacterium]
MRRGLRRARGGVEHQGARGADKPAADLAGVLYRQRPAAAVAR